MNSFKYLVLTAFCAAIPASCGKAGTSPDGPDDESGAVSLCLATGQSATKAVANTNETTLTDVQVFMFNAADELLRYHSLTSDEIASRTCAIKSLKVGTYSMYIVANGPDMASTVRNRADLLATAIELGEYNDARSDFVMGGYEEGVVINADSTTPVSVEISRYVSRVTLSSIKNNLPASFGDMTVNYAVLSNVAANQIIGGSASPTIWYNKDCRMDETTRNSSHIIGIGEYVASAAHDTFAGCAQTVTNGNTCDIEKYFYGYPNSLTARGSGFNDPYAPKATCLDISITFVVADTSRTYWYNVPLQGSVAVPGIARNHDYDVRVIVSGEGSIDPGRYTGKGSISAAVTIRDWIDGAATDIEI